MSVNSGQLVIVFSLILSSLMSPVQGFWDNILPWSNQDSELESRIDELETKIIELKANQPEQGVPGPQGELGTPGPAGPQGGTGPEGSQGPAGPKGEKGEMGPAGPQGLQGEQGIRGKQGESGSQGVSGIDGEPLIPDDKIPDVKVYLGSISPENELDVTWCISYGPSELTPNPLLPVNCQDMIITGGQIAPYAAYFTLPDLFTGNYVLWVTGSIYGAEFTKPCSISVREDYSNLYSNSVYWDDTTIEWNGVKGKLVVYWGAEEISSSEVYVGDLAWVASIESTSYGASFIVPESKEGTHYVWVKNIDGMVQSHPIKVLSSVEVSSSSGFSDSQITVEGHGFGAEKEVMIGLFADYGSELGTLVVNENTGETGTGVEQDFEFAVSNLPLKIGSVTVTDGVEVFTDNGDRTLTGNLGGCGYVNYVTGEIDVEFNDPPLNGVDIFVSYSYYQNSDDQIYLWSGTWETNNVGSVTASVQIPDGVLMETGDYEIVGYDERGNTAKISFTIT